MKLVDPVTDPMSSAPAKKRERFRPFGNSVLLRVLKPGGDILLPENYSPDQTRSVVVAVGPGFLTSAGVRVPIDLRPGDTVLVMGSAVEVVLEGEKDLVVTDAKAVMGVVETIED